MTARAVRRLVPCLGVSLSLVAGSSLAFAEAPHAPRTRENGFALRTEGLGGVRSEADGVIGLFGMSASIRLFNLVQAEGGAAAWINPCSTPLVPTYRLGVSPRVHDPGGGDGWEIQVPVLAEYTSMNLDNTGCDMKRSARAQAVMLATGVDAIAWGDDSVGLDLRGLVFAGPAWVSSGEPYSRPSSPYVAETSWGVQLSVGLAIGP